MSTDELLLDTIFQSVLDFMEIAEGISTYTGQQKKEFVLNKLKEKFDDLFDTNDEVISTAIETVIFLSKVKKRIKINEISKNCGSCFGFI
jgi:hypothetical protein